MPLKIEDLNKTKVKKSIKKIHKKLFSGLYQSVDLLVNEEVFHGDKFDDLTIQKRSTIF